MAVNAVLTQVEKIQFTDGSVVLGYGPGMTVPPRVLVCNSASNITVTLPLTTVTLPLLGQGSNTKSITPGIGPGYLLTILNISGSSTVTLAAASGDSLVDIPVLSGQYSSMDVCSSDTNNTWYRVSQGQTVGVIFTQIASATVGNSTDETSVISTGIGSATLPANFFSVGTTIQIRVFGIHSATANPTLEWRIKLGGTLILDSGAFASHTSTNEALNLLGLITCRTTGTSGTIFAQGTYTESGASTVGMANTGTISIDTTIPQTLDVTAQWGTKSSSDTLTVTNVVLEKIT